MAAAVLLDEFKERGRAVICEITEPALIRKRFERAGIVNRLHHARKRDGHRGLDAFLRDVADYRACGVPECDLRRLVIHVVEFMDALCATGTAEELRTLDITEREIEGEEAALTTRRLCGELTPPAIEREANLDERHAAVELTRARVLRFEANHLRFGLAQGAVQ